MTGAASVARRIHRTRVSPRRAAIRASIDPDKALVERAKAGDQAAFEELIARHQRPVYSLVSRMIFSRDEVDDVASEVFVLAYQNIKRFRGEAAFSTWLYRIAVNLSLKRIKKLSKMKALSLEEVRDKRGEGILEDDAAEPSEEAESSEVARVVQAAVAQLPPKHRAVVSLHYFGDMSCDQIAEILNCSVGTVWSRLHYAMKKLRAALEAEGIGLDQVEG